MAEEKPEVGSVQVGHHHRELRLTQPFTVSGRCGAGACDGSPDTDPYPADGPRTPPADHERSEDSTAQRAPVRWYPGRNKQAPHSGTMINPRNNPMWSPETAMRWLRPSGLSVA